MNENGGVKLYRNGFRVPKYGDKGNDWVDTDKNSRIGQGIPFGNERILGTVQLTDWEGKVFEESAAREGLIEKEAFIELQKFVSSSLAAGFRRFASWFRETDEYKAENPDRTEPLSSNSTEEIVSNLKSATETLLNPNSSDEQKNVASIKINLATKKLVSQTKATIDELEMIRILAGVGLTIAEFIHEVKQLIPSLKGYITSLLTENVSESVEGDLLSMHEVINSLETYTAFFDSTISQNVTRTLKNIDIRDAVRHFRSAIKPDIKRRNIDLTIDYKGQHQLITTAMHPSEWNTILQNLYSNAKKAIIRAGRSEGKILICGYKDIDKKLVFLSFYDNGNGIEKKDYDSIFKPFFTTATPVTNKVALENDNTGTGLGLYILRQIIKNRNGEISVGTPIEGYNTCFTIQLPLHTFN